MTSITPAQPLFDDPRSGSDFQARFYPTANGQAGPDVGANEPNDQITLEFLAAYYRLNLGYVQLVEARKSPDPIRRREMEKECLQSIEKVLILRDSLEDRYAPFGVIADPVVKDGFTVDLKIQFGNVDAAGRRRTETYTLTAYVPIPLPQGATFEDVHMQIEGPGFNGEY
jgi:hypothetical protein